MMCRFLTVPLLLAWPCLGDVVVLLPSKDNTLYENSAGALSNGAGTGMFCGSTAFGLRRRAVLAFDIAAHVPAGSTIQGATLQLSMSMTIAGEEACSLHRLLADWGEGMSMATGGGGGGAPSTTADATWVHTFYPSAFWSAAGGDFHATASGTCLVGGVGVYTWSGAGLVGDVQGWLDQPASNFGWILIGNESAPTTAKRFDTREHPNPNARPVLVVEFSPPCYPDCNGDGVLSLADFGCFQTRYALQSAYADCNGDGALSLADFGCFQTRFALGCP